MSRLIMVVCAAVLAMVAVSAKDAGKESSANENAMERLNPKVDRWAEGIVLSLDADGRSFSIRGCGMAYATAYARMMKEIHAKTEGATAADRKTVEAEVRASWAGSLAKAKESAKPTDVDDISFGLPAKGELKFLDKNGEAKHGDLGLAGERDAEAAAKPLPKDQWSEAEANAVAVFSKMKIGEKVAIGYESGIAFNTAYIVVQSEHPEKALGLEQAQNQKGPKAEPQDQTAGQEAMGRAVHPHNQERK